MLGGATRSHWMHGICPARPARSTVGKDWKRTRNRKGPYAHPHPIADSLAIGGSVPNRADRAARKLARNRMNLRSVYWGLRAAG